jgi:dihydrolipoamide dehydrogenase
MIVKLRNSTDFGIVTDNIKVNFPAIMARKANLVDHLRKGIKQLIINNKITLYEGQARILSPKSVVVDQQKIETDNILIATGSEIMPIQIPGSELLGVLTTDDILELNDIPESLVIIGGGYIGMEFACIFNTFGSRVIILEKQPSCLEYLDKEIVSRFIQNLKRQGIEIITEAAVKCIQKETTLLKVVYDKGSNEYEVEGQVVLIATGRQPYTKDLGLEDLNIAMDGAAIIVNKYLETNIGGIYAAGDVIGRHMLAHVASYEGRISVENALNHIRQIDYRAIPNCVFTQPEIAYVGITEEEAKKNNLPYRVSKFPFHACDRAVVMGETFGLVKLICGAVDRKVLGIHIMGPHASDLIAEGVLAVKLEANADDISDTIHAHPTLSEAVHEAVLGQLDGSIHFQRKS